MKKIISPILVMFIGLLFTLCITPMTKASAGQSDFIVPLFSGYVEDKSKATIIKQNTVIDMSNYLIENGVEVRTLNDGNLTCESLPTLFRNRFKIFVGKRKYN